MTSAVSSLTRNARPPPHTHPQQRPRRVWNADNVGDPASKFNSDPDYDWFFLTSAPNPSKLNLRFAFPEPFIAGDAAPDRERDRRWAMLSRNDENENPEIADTWDARDVGDGDGLGDNGWLLCSSSWSRSARILIRPRAFCPPAPSALELVSNGVWNTVRASMLDTVRAAGIARPLPFHGGPGSVAIYVYVGDRTENSVMVDCEMGQGDHPCSFQTRPHLQDQHPIQSGSTRFRSAPRAARCAACAEGGKLMSCREE